MIILRTITVHGPETVTIHGSESCRIQALQTRTHACPYVAIVKCSFWSKQTTVICFITVYTVLQSTPRWGVSVYFCLFLLALVTRLRSVTLSDWSNELSVFWGI